MLPKLNPGAFNDATEVFICSGALYRVPFSPVEEVLRHAEPTTYCFGTLAPRACSSSWRILLSAQEWYYFISELRELPYRLLPVRT